MSDSIQDKITPKVHRFLWQRASWLASDPGRSAAQEELLSDLVALLDALGDPLDFERTPVEPQLQAAVPVVKPVADTHALVWGQYIVSEPRTGLPVFEDRATDEAKLRQIQPLKVGWNSGELPAIRLEPSDREPPTGPPGSTIRMFSKEWERMSRYLMCLPDLVGMALAGRVQWVWSCLCIRYKALPLPICGPHGAAAFQFAWNFEDRYLDLEIGSDHRLSWTWIDRVLGVTEGEESVLCVHDLSPAFCCHLESLGAVPQDWSGDLVERR